MTKTKDRVKVWPLASAPERKAVRAGALICKRRASRKSKGNVPGAERQGLKFIRSEQSLTRTVCGAGGGGGQGEPEHEARGTCWPAGTVQRGGCGGTVHPLPQKCQVGPWPTWQPVYTLGELTAGGFLG